MSMLFVWLYSGKWDFINFSCVRFWWKTNPSLSTESNLFTFSLLQPNPTPRLLSFLSESSEDVRLCFQLFFAVIRNIFWVLLFSFNANFVCCYSVVLIWLLWPSVIVLHDLIFIQLEFQAVEMNWFQCATKC